MCSYRHSTFSFQNKFKITYEPCEHTVIRLNRSFAFSLSFVEYFCAIFFVIYIVFIVYILYIVSASTFNLFFLTRNIKHPASSNCLFFETRRISRNHILHLTPSLTLPLTVIPLRVPARMSVLIVFSSRCYRSLEHLFQFQGRGYVKRKRYVIC